MRSRLLGKPSAGRRLRRCANCALGLRCQAGKSRRIFYRQVRQNLAIEFDTRHLQPVDELVVAHAVQLGGGAKVRTIRSRQYCRLRCLRPE